MKRETSIRVWFERKVEELGEALKRLPGRSLPPERSTVQVLQGGRSKATRKTETTQSRRTDGRE